MRLLTTVENRPFTDADPVRLRQAVGNPVSHAVRHTPRGGTVTRRAGTRGPEQGEGSRIVIEVADAGSGIGARELTRVFDRFWRAARSRSRQTGGSGLGLSFVRRPAEAHGGTVAAAGTAGAGPVFTLMLPR